MHAGRITRSSLREVTRTILHHFTRYKNQVRSSLIDPYKSSHEFDQVEELAIGCIVVRNIMPLNEGLRSLSILFLVIKPVWPNRSDPVHVYCCLIMFRLVSNLLDDSFPSVIPMLGVINFNNKNCSDFSGCGDLLDIENKV